MHQMGLRGPRRILVGSRTKANVAGSQANCVVDVVWIWASPDQALAVAVMLELQTVPEFRDAKERMSDAAAHNDSKSPRYA